MKPSARHRSDPRRQVPRFDIGTALAELGATQVPTGFGWVRMRCYRADHDDRTASASVNRERGRFRCFGCGISGDAIDLYQLELGLSFIEAVDQLKNLTGISTDKPIKKRRASELLGRT